MYGVVLCHESGAKIIFIYALTVREYEESIGKQQTSKESDMDKEIRTDTITQRLCSICMNPFDMEDFIVERVENNISHPTWDSWDTSHVHLSCAFRGSSK